MGAAKPVKPNGMCAYKKGGSFIDREVDDKSMKMGGTALKTSLAKAKARDVFYVHAEND